jgi:TolB-like protein
VSTGDAPGTERTTGTGTGSQPRRVRWPIVAAAIAVAALLSLTATARWARGGKEPSPAVQDSTYDVNRMAVLYFDDHSLEQNLGPIANGITEELIHQLAGVNAFQVISRNGVKPFRSRPVSVDSLARALRVGSLVEGSVQQSGTRLRVTVQFIDTRSGTHLDSRTFEQPREELFALEERIGQEIAAALRRRLGRQLHPRQVRAGTRAYRAAELVLTGDAQLDAADSILTRCDTASRRLGIAALERADSLYAQAAAADSRWSLPWIGRGWAVRRRALMEEDDRRPPLYELALEHAADAVRRDSTEPRALELRGTLAWGLVQISPALQRDPRRTGAVGRDLEAAVARDTTLASAWATLSGYYRSRGQFAEAQDAAKQAFAADAYLASAQRVFPQIISSEYVNHHPDSARAYCSRARLLMPENWHFIECELTRMLYEDDRRPDPAGAWSIVRRLQALDEREHFTACGFEYATTYWPMVAATIEARAGNAAVARRVLAEARKAVAGRPDLRVSFEPDEAYLLHVLGAEDSALAIKRRLSTENAILARYFESDPRLKQIGAGVRGTTGTR